jgi:murein DD-endopeptidase MepM/ murein hydrolase activator NlpD
MKARNWSSVSATARAACAWGSSSRSARAKGPRGAHALGAFARVAFVLALCCPRVALAAQTPESPSFTLNPQSIVDGGVGRIRAVIPAGFPDAPPAGEMGGRALAFYPAGPPRAYEALFGVERGSVAGEAKVSVWLDPGRKTELPFQVVAGTYKSEILKVDPRLVKPPKRALKRIKREQKEVGLVYSQVLKAKLWSGPFRLPIPSEITSDYGTARVYNGEHNGYHFGTDLRAPVGTEIRAPAGGKVVMAKSLYYTGNTVLLDHGYGLITLYAHMSKLKVRKGQEVKAGALLGLAGMTGRVNGPHLHWGAILHRVKVNPMELTRAGVLE